MKLNKMSKDELEVYSYGQLTRMILLEEKKPLSTPTLFKRICSLLEMSDNDYMEKVGDYYTSLATDKDFVLLDDGNWDLRDNHPVQVNLDEEDIDDESMEDEIVMEEDIMEEAADETLEDNLDDDDEDDDETADLSIITEGELDE